jgi:hypothetical protein
LNVFVLKKKCDSRADKLLQGRFERITTSFAMPKDECSGVLGHAPRKALAVKKAPKKGPSKAPAKNCDTSGKAPKKGPGEAQAEQCDTSGNPPKKPAPTGLEVVCAAPCSPRSPSYEPESWWDSHIDLARRINESFEALKDLKAYVTRLEEEFEKDRAARSL